MNIAYYYYSVNSAFFLFSPITNKQGNNRKREGSQILTSAPYNQKLLEQQNAEEKSASIIIKTFTKSQSTKKMQKTNYQ